MDPRKATDTTSISLIKMSFEGLLRREGSINALGIAKSYSMSDDLCKITFILRDAEWWDGQKIRAQDFEESWKMILNPEFPSPFSNDLYVIKNGEAAKKGLCSLDQVGVKSIDDTTLEVTLEHPSPYILDLISSHSFLPVPYHIVSKNPNWADEAGQLYVGNGPFKLKSWRHHNHVIFEKNENYWDKDAVKLETIHFTIIPDETTELNMFESGDLHWAGNPLSTLPSDALQALKEQNRLNICPMAAVYYYVFNVKEAPFNNLHLRKAFAYAINRQEIVDNITQTDQVAATGFVPDIIRKYKIDYFQDADIEKAQWHFEKALEEMGLTQETFPPITLSYNTTAGHHRIAQAIAQQWYQAFGVKIILSNKEWKVFLDELAHRQFSVARMGGVASYNDPIAFLHLFRYEDSCHNVTGWTNPAFTALLDEADRTLDQTRRDQILREAEKIFIDEMPIAPIYYYTGSFLQNPKLKNVSTTEFFEIDFKYAYLETR